MAVKSKNIKRAGLNWPEVGLIIAGLAGLGFGVNYLVKTIRRNKAEGQTTKENQQAMLLRSALYTNFFGLDVISFVTPERLYEIARTITDYDKVVKAYRVLYNDSLETDLRSGFTSSSNFETFLNIINGNTQNNYLKTLKTVRDSVYYTDPEFYKKESPVGKIVKSGSVLPGNTDGSIITAEYKGRTYQIRKFGLLGLINFYINASDVVIV